MRKRMFWADLTRVIAIYLVVLIHNLSFPQRLEQQNFITFMVQAISRTSIPLFILLSGSLLIGKKESYSLFFKKRVLKVIIPWLAWTLLFILWDVYFSGKTVSSFKDFKYFFELTLFTNLWFLPLIAGVYLLTPLWRKFTEISTKKDRIYLVSIMFLFSSILPFFHNGPTFPLDNGGIFTKAFQYSSYFLMGFVVLKDRLFFENKKFLYAFFVFGLAFTILETLNVKPVEQVYSYLAPNIAILSISLFSILLKEFENRKVSSRLKVLFEYLSIASLGVYILHQPVMFFLNPYLFSFRNSLSGISLSLSGVIMALIYFSITSLLVFVLQKTPVKKILP